MKNLNSNFNSTSCCASVSADAATYVAQKIFCTKNPKGAGTFAEVPDGILWQIMERSTNACIGCLYEKPEVTYRKEHSGHNDWIVLYGTLEPGLSFKSAPQPIWNREDAKIFLESPLYNGEQEKAYICRAGVYVDFYLKEASLCHYTKVAKGGFFMSMDWSGVHNPVDITKFVGGEYAPNKSGVVYTERYEQDHWEAISCYWDDLDHVMMYDYISSNGEHRHVRLTLYSTYEKPEDLWNAYDMSMKLESEEAPNVDDLPFDVPKRLRVKKEEI